MFEQNKSFGTKVLDTIQPFVIGGVSGCISTLFIQPVDLVKVRIQLKSEALGLAAKGQVSPLQVISEIYGAGGVWSFWRGLDSALARQIFYTTTRMGIYKSMFSMFKEKRNGQDPSFGEKMQCSLVAGFIGSLAGNPADLALVRMQSDTALPVAERRGYKNVFDAFARITKEEGALALWRGCTPTVIRAMVLNAAMLGPYDEIKEQLNKLSGTKDTQQTRLISSAIAGFMASFSSLPFDNAKTKLQKMRKDANGNYPYANIFDAMMRTVRNEGVRGLWVGFPTYYFRIAPHSMGTLLVQDYITDKVKSYRAH